MNDKYEWVSLVKRNAGEMPSWIVDEFKRANALIAQSYKENVEEGLSKTTNTIKSKLIENVAITAQACSTALNFELTNALLSGASLDKCYKLFEELTRSGHTSLSSKNAIVISLLTYLEDKMPRNDLGKIVEVMTDENQRQIADCEANIVALKSFKKDTK